MPNRQQVFFFNCIHLIWLHLYRSLLFWQTPKFSKFLISRSLTVWEEMTAGNTEINKSYFGYLIWFFHTGGCERAALRDFLKKIYWNVKDTIAWTGSQMGKERGLPVKFKKQMTQTKNHPTHKIKKQFDSSSTKSLVRDYTQRFTRKREKSSTDRAKKNGEKKKEIHGGVPSFLPNCNNNNQNNKKRATQ